MYMYIYYLGKSMLYVDQGSEVDLIGGADIRELFCIN